MQWKLLPSSWSLGMSKCVPSIVTRPVLCMQCCHEIHESSPILAKCATFYPCYCFFFTHDFQLLDEFVLQYFDEILVGLSRNKHDARLESIFLVFEECFILDIFAMCSVQFANFSKMRDTVVCYKTEIVQGKLSKSFTRISAWRLPVEINEYIIGWLKLATHSGH